MKPYRLDGLLSAVAPLFSVKRRHALTGFSLVIPAVALLVVFYLIPIGYALRFSLYEITHSERVWVGVQNYITLVQNKVLLRTVTVALKFFSIQLLGGLVISYLIAAWLHQANPRFAAFLRSCYYVPVVLSALVTIAVWRWFFRFEGGAFNNILATFNLPSISWLGHPRTAIWSLSLTLLTNSLGGLILLYSAAMGQINKELFDAARIDGASEWQIIWHIITPLTKPIRVYIVFMNLVGAVQIWEHPFFFTGGGPLDSTKTPTYEIFHTAFMQNNLGLASALTVVTFVGISMVVWFFMKKLEVRFG